jgi:hypothetical protein
MYERLREQCSAAVPWQTLSESLRPQNAHLQCDPSLVLGDLQVCGNRLEVLHHICFFIICQS